MKMLGKLIAIHLVVSISLILVACGASFKYDKDAAIIGAQNLIDAVNAKDYQAAVDMLPANLQSQISAEKLRDSWDSPLTSSGAFEKYEQIKTSVIEQNGIRYIVVVCSCKYENDSRTFTITFTTDMKVAALEMR